MKLFLFSFIVALLVSFLVLMVGIKVESHIDIRDAEHSAFMERIEQIEANQRRIESKLDMLLTPEGPPPPCFDTAPFTIP